MAEPWNCQYSDISYLRSRLQFQLNFVKNCCRIRQHICFFATQQKILSAGNAAYADIELTSLSAGLNIRLLAMRSVEPTGYTSI